MTNSLKAVFFVVVAGLLNQRVNGWLGPVRKIVDPPATLIHGAAFKAVDTAANVAQEIVPDSLGLSDPENSTEACYGGLGCFPLGKPWTSVLRPLPEPYGPQNISASTTLYTRKAPQGFHQSFNASYRLEGSDFQPRRVKTVFITHGFAANGDSKWLQEMKDAYLQNEDANVFIVDWGKGASLINYLQAASNTRIVGAEIAKYVRFLIGNGLNTTNLHLIGHSLGSHIMAYCAKNISEINKVDRITALDPAQPAFEGNPEKVRLASTDAVNIDVIHTDAKPFLVFLGFGMLSPVGSVDFYMNGGSMQPGCLQVKTPNITSLTDLLQYPVEVVAEWVSCSHGRSYEYFTAALKLRNCSFWGRKMSKTENFLKIGSLGRLSLADPVVDTLSKCSPESCSVIGLDTFKLPARGSFSVTTKGDPPYCETSEEEKQHLKSVLTLGLSDYIPDIPGISSLTKNVKFF